MPESTDKHPLMREALAVLHAGFAFGLAGRTDNLPLSNRTLMSQFKEYIDRYSLTDRIDILETDENDDRIAQVVKPGSCSSISKLTIYVSSKVKLSDSEISGILAHEVGTHALRMLNDDQQIWAKNNRKTFALKPHQTTEEGLACLNSIVATCNNPTNILWYPALRYWAAAISETKSLNDLYLELTPYIENDDSRLRFCKRVQRAGTKDQAYFIGAIDLLRNMNQTDFTALYAGMVHRDDSKRLRLISRTKEIVLPFFMNNMSKYMQKLRTIAEANGIQTKLDASMSVPRELTRDTRSSRGRSITRSSSTTANQNFKRRTLSMS